MSKITFLCNNVLYEVDANPSATLLDFIRINLRLTGTKEGCREGDCGACTVLIGRPAGEKIIYKSVNSCLTPLNKVQGSHVVTIEGLNSNKPSLIQQAFIDEGAVQCGFCTPGFIISITGYLLNSGKPCLEELKDAAAGNLCRCTGHVSIIRALSSILEKISMTSNDDRITNLIMHNILPEYFRAVRHQLLKIKSTITGNNEPSDAGFIISGGTDLYVQKGRAAAASENHFVLNPPGKLIYIENNHCYVHASAAIEDISRSEVIGSVIPGISGYLKLFGSLPIRNSATAGGNIVNASPIGDLINILLPLSARLILNSTAGSRTAELVSFYKGYKIRDIQPGEILTQIFFPLPEKPYLINFEKVSKREHLDIATVNSTILIRTENNFIKEASLSAGGVAPVPLLLNRTGEYLTGKEINAELVSAAALKAASEISPISDIRGSADYKRLLLSQLIKAHFIKLFPELFQEAVI